MPEKSTSKYDWQKLNLPYANPVQFANNYIKTAIINCGERIGIVSAQLEKLRAAKMLGADNLQTREEIMTFARKLAIHSKNLRTLTESITDYSQESFENIAYKLLKPLNRYD